MPAELTCPSCRCLCRIPVGVRADTIPCPRCGVDIGASPDDHADSRALAPDPEEIITWLSQPAGPPGTRAFAEDPACTSCGYTGQMIYQANRRACPACHAGLPTPAEREVHCSDCGLMIGIREQDRDKTVICPRCKSFLGCVSKAEGNRSERRRNW